MSWWQRAHERFPPFFLRFPHLFRRPATSTGRTELAMWRARRERQGVAGRQATQAARRLRVVGMTTPRLAERNRIERTPGGVHINTEEHCRTVSSPTRNHQAHTDPSELNPLFPYVFSPTPGGDASLSHRGDNTNATGGDRRTVSRGTNILERSFEPPARLRRAEAGARGANTP